MRSPIPVYEGERCIMAQPFISWLASYPKSGNTWVRALLDAYVVGDLFNYNNMDLVASEPVRETYIGLRNTLDEYDVYDWACMRGAALTNWLLTRGTDGHMFMKTHTANVYMHDMPLMPQKYTKKAVYIIRDPRDVIISAAKYFRHSLEKQWEKMRDDTMIMGAWDKPMSFQPCGSWRMNVLSWTQEERFPVHLVKYEDLLADTAGTFRKILKFYGFEIDEAKIQRAVELTEFSRLQKLEQKFGFRDDVPKNEEKGKTEDRQFFRVGKARQWETEMPKEMQEAVWNEYKDLYPLWGPSQKVVKSGDNKSNP